MTWGFDDVWTTVNVHEHFKKDVLCYGRMAVNYIAVKNSGGLQSNKGVEGRDELAISDLKLMRKRYPKLELEKGLHTMLNIFPTPYMKPEYLKEDDIVNQE